MQPRTGQSQEGSVAGGEGERLRMRREVGSGQATCKSLDCTERALRRERLHLHFKSLTLAAVRRKVCGVHSGSGETSQEVEAAAQVRDNGGGSKMRLQRGR